MSNKNLHLSVINNGESYEARKHAACKLLQRFYDMEGYRKEIRTICQAEARIEKAQFGNTTTADELRECTKTVMAYMLEHVNECIAGDFDKSRQVYAEIRRWFDKVNGNSYFSAKIEIPQGDEGSTFVVLPFEYGYGSYPEYVCYRKLIDMGIVDHPGFYDNGSMKGCISDAKIKFIDYGYTLRRNMYAQ